MVQKKNIVTEGDISRGGIIIESGGVTLIVTFLARRSRIEGALLTKELLMISTG